MGTNATVLCAVSRTAQGSHVSAWQGRVHMWAPQARVRPQTAPQLSSVSPHLSANTAPFGHPHLTSVVMRHGGRGWGGRGAGRDAVGSGDGDAAGLAAGAAPLAAFVGLVQLRIRHPLFRCVVPPCAPFETAGESLAGVLACLLRIEAENGARGGGVGRGSGQGWETGDMAGGESEEGEERDPPRVWIDRFRMELVLLHTLWRDGSTPAPQTLALAAHAAHAVRSFARLISVHVLPEELISAGSASESENEKKKNGVGRRSAPAEPTTSTSGAGVQNDNNNNNERVEGKEERKQRQRKTQALHLARLLGVHTALLGMGVRELGKVDVYVVPAPAAAVNAPQKLSMCRRSLRPLSASVSVPKDSDSSSAYTSPYASRPSPISLPRLPPALHRSRLAPAHTVEQSQIALDLVVLVQQPYPHHASKPLGGKQPWRLVYSAAAWWRVVLEASTGSGERVTVRIAHTVRITVSAARPPAPAAYA
ncbi:hypothetical protein B0H14DRAFT_3446722 [Mycena olivaceomarginata]|nr:hypothetical protein B0H14DRAFT_3446722 [Mycena olivaceomarginata]